VADAEEVCIHDPQLAARGHFVDVPTPEGETVRLDSFPALLSHTPATVRGPGPLLGEHTHAVLHELLGLDPETLERLESDGVIAGPAGHGAAR
jgi:crotonobetainyl-CoA:carnitine CoA-transferase CaiB-like acyl-CoA transferase